MTRSKYISFSTTFFSKISPDWFFLSWTCSPSLSRGSGCSVVMFPQHQTPLRVDSELLKIFKVKNWKYPAAKLKRFAICLIFTAIFIHHFYYHYNSKWNRLSHFSVVAREVHQIRAFQQEKECLEQFSMWAICKLFWLLFLGEVSCSSCIAFM